MSTCRRRGRSRAEARREESARLVEQIAGAVGRLVLGCDLPPEVGLGAIDLYATVTGDSILSAFARGALSTGSGGLPENGAPEPGIRPGLTPKCALAG